MIKSTNLHDLSYMHQKQVVRLLAMAMADDGSVGRVEFEEVCAIVREQWRDKNDMPSMEEVEAIVKDLKDALQEPTTRQSIFMNVDALTNEDVTIEVRNLMRIIVIDNSITDREREAFIIYCRMMRVCNTSQLWRDMSRMTIDELRNPAIKGPAVKFRRKSARMSLSDFEMIQEAFSFYKIHSPVLDGAFHILQREKTRNLAHIVRQNKRFNHLAFTLFIICGTFIYALVAMPITHNYLADHKMLYSSIISICILIMMLAIEWLIFARSNAHGSNDMVVHEKPKDGKTPETSSKQHTSLALFVGIAILLDVCLGIIELPVRDVGIYGISIKILSAIFLGCICFFTGKFFENMREQQIGDIGKMDEITQNLHIMAQDYHKTS